MCNLTLSPSIIFLLNASRVANGETVSFFVNPNDRTNFFTASGLIPLLRNPSRVGNLGSSYHGTLPLSISGFSSLFDTGIPSRSSLPKKMNSDFSIPNLSKIV